MISANDTIYYAGYPAAGNVAPTVCESPTAYISKAEEKFETSNYFYRYPHYIIFYTSNGESHEERPATYHPAHKVVVANTGYVDGDSSQQWLRYTVSSNRYGDYGIGSLVMFPNGHLYKITGWSNVTYSSKDMSKALVLSSGPPVGKFVGALIVKKPYLRVTNFTAKRTSDDAFKLSWDIPSALTDSREGSRATAFKLEYEMSLGSLSYLLREQPEETSDRGARVKTYTTTLQKGDKSETFDLFEVASHFSRDSMYPKADGNAQRLTLRLSGYNVFGKADSAASTVVKFGPPEPPELDKYMTYDPSGGDQSQGVVRLTAKYKRGWKTRSDGYECECYDMVVSTVISEWGGATASTSRSMKVYAADGDGTDSNETQNLVIQVPNHQGMLYGQRVTITVTAYCRGIAGDSQSVVRKLVIGYPEKPVIKRILEQNDKLVAQISLGSLDDSGGIETVVESTSNIGVVAQCLRSVTYEKAADVPEDYWFSTHGARGWEDVGMEDDGNCTALSLPMESIAPAPGKISWVRVVAWSGERTFFSRPSNPTRLYRLERPAPTAADDEIVIYGASPKEDGSAITLDIAWDKDGDDDSTHTEVSWSDREDAWRSTDRPETFDMPDEEWDDGAVTLDVEDTVIDSIEVVGVKGRYNASSRLVIGGLTDGTEYYIKARRVRDPSEILDGSDAEEERVTYGPYSEVVKCRASSKPKTVTLTCPSMVAIGEALSLTWAYSGTTPQKSWRVMLQSGANQSTSDVILASGEDSTTAHSVEWERMAPYSDGRVKVYVAISTGGDDAYSETKTLSFRQRPVLVAPEVIEISGQPAYIPIACSAMARLDIVLTSRLVSGDTPWGEISQADGDTVWSESLTPEWQVPNASYNAAITRTIDSLDNLIDSYSDRFETEIANNMALEDTVESRQEALSDALEDKVDLITEGAEMSEIMAAESAVATATRNLNDALRSLRMLSPSAVVINYENYLARRSVLAANLEAATLGGDFWVSLKLPMGLDLLNGAVYDLKVVATDGTLKSEPLTATLAVSFDHEAVTPSRYVEVTPYDESENGYRTLGTRISLPYTAGAYASDVYDVYRVTPDGSSLVAEGMPAGSVVDDRYAPFGTDSTVYRVVLRTLDGHLAWRDYGYALLQREPSDDRMLRIDWDGDYVELTHCVTLSDSMEKSFEQVVHLDGSVSGHWDEAVTRSSSYGTALMDGVEDEEIAALKRLANYSGPCMVRASDGSAYVADVQVGGLSVNYNSVRVDVSLNAREIAMTDEFRAALE